MVADIQLKEADSTKKLPSLPDGTKTFIKAISREHDTKTTRKITYGEQPTFEREMMPLTLNNTFSFALFQAGFGYMGGRSIGA
jgi:hypothetical protein